MGCAVLLLLCWIATADGNLSDHEIVSLRATSDSHGVSDHLQTIVAMAKSGSVDDLQAACELMRHLEKPHRRLVLELFLSMAMADGRLTTTEIHVLRFLTDALSLPPKVLDKAFYSRTSHRFPAPGDMSNPDWWKSREASFRERPRPGMPGENDNRGNGSNDAGRFRDLAILGLDESASMQDIRAAYRRMAHVHHPDRYASLGREAVLAAEISFKRIQQAYDRLGAR